MTDSSTPSPGPARGEDHPEFAKTLRRLALACRGVGDVEAAAEWNRRVAVIEAQ